MSENRINKIAVIIITIIIISVVVNFVVKSMLEKAPGITGLDVRESRFYIIDKNQVKVYSHEGTKLMSFTFSYEPDELFFMDKGPVIYDYETETCTLFNDYFHPVSSRKIGKFDTVVYLNGKLFAVSVRHKTVTQFDEDFSVVKTVRVRHKPYAVFADEKGTMFFSAYKSNRIYTLDGEKETILNKLSDSGTIIKIQARDGKYHMIQADGKFFSVRYCTYDVENGKTMASHRKYYYPVDMEGVKDYFFVSDNTRNIIDVYSLDDKYLCQFGNSSFKDEFLKIYHYRKRLLYTGVLMNVLIITGFFVAIALYVYSKNKVRKQ